MSFNLALQLASTAARREAEKRAELLRNVGRVDLALEPRRQRMIGDATGGDALAVGLGAGGIIAVLGLFVLGLYFEWIRFRDGTKWERIMQGASILVGLLEIPAVLAKASPATLAAMELLRAGTDGYAAGHQLWRGEHHIANGLALLADAWGIVDTAILTSAALQQGARGTSPISIEDRGGST